MRTFKVGQTYNVTTTNDLGEHWTNENIVYVGGGTSDRSGSTYLGFRKGNKRYLIDSSHITDVS